MALTQTANKTILEEALNLYYHAMVTKNVDRDPKVIIDRLKVLSTDIGGMKEEIDQRFLELENFNRELQGNLRQRCEISSVHLDCLRQVLS